MDQLISILCELAHAHARPLKNNMVSLPKSNCHANFQYKKWDIQVTRIATQCMYFHLSLNFKMGLLALFNLMQYSWVALYFLEHHCTLWTQKYQI